MALIDLIYVYLAFTYGEFVFQSELELTKPVLNYIFNPKTIQVRSNYNLIEFEVYVLITHQVPKKEAFKNYIHHLGEGAVYECDSASTY